MTNESYGGPHWNSREGLLIQAIERSPRPRGDQEPIVIGRTTSDFELFGFLLDEARVSVKLSFIPRKAMP